VTDFTLEGPLAQARYPGGTIFQFEAVDPTTRANVAGVAITDAALYGYDLSGQVSAIEDVIPAYTADETFFLDG
jgi:hypothetical protein